jgi:hypothetical protein
MEAPTTFDHDTLHSVINDLAVIVSFAQLLGDQIPHTEITTRALAEIRSSAIDAAARLGRPLAIDED